MQVSIVIPVYNEGKNIIRTLASIKQDMRAEYNIMVVYDSDEDTTLPALDEAEKELNIKVTRLRNKYGRGALNAIKSGLEEAETEYVIVTMADLSDPPSVMNDMIRKAETENADIVCGSRYMKGGSQTGGPKLKGLMSRLAGVSLYHLVNFPTHDPTNSFKLYRKSFLEKNTIESNGGFELGFELVVKAWKQGCNVAEVPTSWNDRTNGQSNFKLWKWLPYYLRWYFTALSGKTEKKIDKEGFLGFSGIVLFLLFLIIHLPVFTIFDDVEEWIPLLQLSNKHALKFGHDVIFTYGPLGYLLFPIEPLQLLISSLISLGMLLPFGIFFIRKLSFTDFFFLLVFTIVSITCSAYDLFVFLFPMLIWNVLEIKNPWFKYGGIVYTGILAAGAVLIKFMCAPVILFSLLINDILLFRRKKFILALPVFLFFLFLIWCYPARQDISHLYHFFVYSWQISVGYNHSMFLDNSSPLWFIIFSGGAFLIFGVTFLADRKKDLYKFRIEKFLYRILLIPSIFVIYKYGTVRTDTQHIFAAVQYLAIMAAFCSMYYCCMHRKWRFILIIQSFLLLFLPISVLKIKYDFPAYHFAWLAVFSATALIYILVKYDFFSRLSAFILMVISCITLLLPVYGIYCPWIFQLNSTMIQQQKFFVNSNNTAKTLPTADYFTFNLLSLMDNVKYHPRLVIQSYSAYTPMLIQKNASHFEYNSGPEYIFYGRHVIDSMLPSSYDSISLLHLINNYDVINHKKMLRKKNVCPPKLHLTKIQTCYTEFNRVVDLPRKNQFIWMSVKINNTLLGKMLKYAIRPAAIKIQLTLDNGKTVTHKILPECSSIPFLISPYMSEWDQLDALLSNTDSPLPKCISFSVYPVFRFFSHHFDLEGWDRKIGEAAYDKNITIHFYRMDFAAKE